MYGRFLHRVVRARAARRQYFATFFFRNRPQLQLLRRLADQTPPGSLLRLAFLGCSNGAETYSVLWTLRSARPDLKVVSHAVDISPEILELATNGVYSLAAPQLVSSDLFAHVRQQEMQAMFDAGEHPGEVKIKPWLKDGITWSTADAASPELLPLLGPQDMVIANNFLCHLDPQQAERCLRNVARLVSPGGYLCVSGIDLDVRAKVAHDLGWRPVRALVEDIHDGDGGLRDDWPCQYWGIEPLSKRERAWEMRYASVFQLGERRPPRPGGAMFAETSGDGRARK